MIGDYATRDKSADIEAAWLCCIGIAGACLIATIYLIAYAPPAAAQKGETQRWLVIVQDRTPLIVGRYASQAAGRAALPGECSEREIRGGYFEYRYRNVALAWIIDARRVTWTSLPLYSKPPSP